MVDGPDASAPDSSAPDSGNPDSSNPDSGDPDSGNPDGGDGCNPACAAGEFCDAEKSCRVCNATQGCAADTVCDATANGGKGSCKTCIDTATGAGTDTGCDATAPICDVAAKGGAGACRVCLASGTGTDLGCSSPAGRCDATGSGGAGTCRVCLTDGDCPGSQSCRADGTACEGCADNASCAAETPVCKSTVTPSACVECTIADSQRCDASRPTCANDFCGCSTDADCAAVAGSAKDFCDTTANAGHGQCEVCLTDSQCESSDPTRPICDGKAACICRTNADCSLDRVCDGDSRACEPSPVSTTRAQTSAQLQALIAAAAGTLAPGLPVTGGFVTYLKPEVVGQVPSEPVGFFVQAEANGPAVLVTDPTAFGQVHVGDRVAFTATSKAKVAELDIVTGLTDLVVVSTGHPVRNLAAAKPAGLKVDHSAATAATLVTGVANVASELIMLQGKIGTGAELGAGFMGYAVTTAGITTATNNLRLRLPKTMATELDVTAGCQFTLNTGVMLRSGAVAQPSAFSTADVTVSSCPAPKLVSAKALSPMQVVLTFDRNIADASITNVMTQFTFDGGLVANAAVVTGNTVTLTTGPQTPGTLYTVTVASSVTDKAGSPVPGANNTQTFKGFRPRAMLRITEVGPTMASNEDLVELVAVSGGTVEGFVLLQDINSPVTLGTFPDVTVATGDVIVVHINGKTDSETVSKDQFAASAVPDNYDTAWDFKGGTTGITFSSRLLVVRDSDGAIQDGVAFHKIAATPPSGYPANLQALQAEGHWLPADCGGAPCTFNSTPSAADVSADWTALPASNATKASNTVRRVSATDTNRKDDWAVGAQSWGLPNP